MRTEEYPIAVWVFSSMLISNTTFNYQQSPFFKNTGKHKKKVSRCIVDLHLAHAVIGLLVFSRLVDSSQVV